MSYLFVFRVGPDIDHITPLAWKLIQEGEEVHAIISPGYDPASDHRLRFLAGFERFHLHEVDRRPRGRSKLARLWADVSTIARGSLPFTLLLLLRHRVRVVGVEWGYGLPAGFGRLRSPTGWAAVARSLARSLVRSARRDPHQPRVNAIVGARLLDRPVVCLPHGLSIKTDTAPNEQLVAAVREGTLDYSDRNHFTAYVLNTEFNRRFYVDQAKLDPQVLQSWGSLRWSPEWFAINRDLVAPWAWPDDDDARLKVVMMVPKWVNRVDGPAVVELVARLQDLDFVSLALKGHPRGNLGKPDPLRTDPRIRWDALHDVGKVDSVALIGAADVVLDVGSSIGLEVVLQEKLLVNPTYVHEPKTLFDAIPGSCVVAHDADAVVEALEAAAAGRAPQPDADALRELLRRAVYADRPEPFDVLGYYAGRFRELASAGG